ncbi:MAG: hypothetical protein PHG59_02695 [Patescibacteria group bacterium]|jgi:hypothetical protein|nr:hypothetical protein [Patescibacteria group bacterium]
MLNIIIGALIIVAGFMVIWKNEWILKNFGRVGWAEEHLGLEGGSRLFYKFIGICFMFLGLFVITGLWTDILTGIFKFFGGQRH